MVELSHLIAAAFVRAIVVTPQRAVRFRFESGTPIPIIEERCGTLGAHRATLILTIDEKSGTLTTDERSGKLGTDRVGEHRRGQDDRHGGGGGGGGEGEASDHDVGTPILL